MMYCIFVRFKISLFLKTCLFVFKRKIYLIWYSTQKALKVVLYLKISIYMYFYICISISISIYIYLYIFIYIYIYIYCIYILYISYIYIYVCISFSIFFNYVLNFLAKFALVTRLWWRNVVLPRLYFHKFEQGQPFCYIYIFNRDERWWLEKTASFKLCKAA